MKMYEKMYEKTIENCTPTARLVQHEGGAQGEALQSSSF